MNQTNVWKETVTIPTYEAGTPDKNPMFLEKRVYQGSSGRVYPHPVTETVANQKTDREYTAVFLENDYLKVMVLPEIGGRIQRIYDKTNGYDAVYYNEVIKPALVGLAGPWISGGIEFNWPQHHRPSTFDPVDYTFKQNGDGSATIWVGEIEKMFHTKGMASFTLYPDKAYLEIKGQLYNPTERTQTFLWWANPAVAVNDYTQSVFPPDVHAVMDHGKRDVSRFPVATGTYYKMDYSEGVDISRYKNIPVPTSYMAYHSDYNFVGNYDHQQKAGLLHLADHHISPGKKQWTWGCGDFGKAWDRNLTDENGPYIELMTGVYTDNQPDFTFLAPYEEKSFVQYFMPYKEVGAVKNATLDVMINLEVQDGTAKLSAYAPSPLEQATILFSGKDNILFQKQVDLSPKEPFSASVPCGGETHQDLYFAVLDRSGNVLVDFTPPEEKIEKTPEPAKAALAPEDIPTCEELYLTALHLEQYRHATYCPEDYYLEGLKRDSSDIRLNNGYGKLLYKKGCYEDAEPYLRKAVEKSIWKNPNPYDSEPYYNLGLCLKALGRTGEAFDAFYKATWSSAMQDMSFYQLSCIAAAREDLHEALDFAERSYQRGMHNMKTRNLKTTLLRLVGKTQEAHDFALETNQIDPLDFGSRYELYCLTQENGCLSELHRLMRGDAHNYIELALNYLDAGLLEEASKILALAEGRCTPDPMLFYYLALASGNDSYLETASACSSDYCFPNRLSDICPLEYAIAKNPKDSRAPYYLGNLLYDKGQHEKAVILWEKAASLEPGFATVHRNLSLAYYNKQHDPQKALDAMEKAFSCDPSDARVFFELDQLYKQLNTPFAKRLETMENNSSLLELRDDLYTEYMTLLNLSGQYQKALDCILAHQFHPWEGGEGKITAQYRAAHMELAKQLMAAGQYGQARAHLEDALSFPENLGEGKLAGAMDNDLYYLLGCSWEAENPQKAADFFTLAARGSSDLSSAMYYNDQPPEMFYFRALAEQKLGLESLAKSKFNHLVDYGENHLFDSVKIDYFAVSLPDFLIYDADLDRKNHIHCCYLLALGFGGLGLEQKSKAYAEEALSLDNAHQGLISYLQK